VKTGSRDRSDDGKSYRIGRTEQLLFDVHSTQHISVPAMSTAATARAREWVCVRRALDGRPFIILPDDGLSLIPSDMSKTAHALLLAIDKPDASMGEIFNCGDDEKRRSVRSSRSSRTKFVTSGNCCRCRHSSPSRATDEMNYRTSIASWTRRSCATGSAIATSCRRAPQCAAPRDGSSRTHRARRLRRDRAARSIRLTRPKTARALWRTAIADPPIRIRRAPGYGKSYPARHRNVRADTRI